MVELKWNLQLHFNSGQFHFAIPIPIPIPWLAIPIPELTPALKFPLPLKSISTNVITFKCRHICRATSIINIIIHW